MASMALRGKGAVHIYLHFLPAGCHAHIAAVAFARNAQSENNKNPRNRLSWEVWRGVDGKGFKSPPASRQANKLDCWWLLVDREGRKRVSWLE